MIKKTRIFLSLLSLIFLSGCNAKTLPDGDIKTFIYNFDYDEAYLNTNICSSKVIQKDFKGENEIGSLVSNTVFEKNDNFIYFYEEIKYSGNYVENNINSYQELDYLIDGKFYSKILSNNIEQTPLTIKGEIDKKITNYFYTTLNSNYHMYGKYYGDNILVNAANYYENFTLNSSKDMLTYTLKNDLTKKGYVINNSYTVDKFGMVTNQFSEIKSLDSSGLSVMTNFEAKYNGEIEKKENI